MSNPSGGGTPPSARTVVVNTIPNSVELNPEAVFQAMRAVPETLNRLPHAGPGSEGVVYLTLLRELGKRGYPVDIVEWAIHRHVEAGRLVAVPGYQGRPSLWTPGIGMHPQMKASGSTPQTSVKEQCRLRATPELFGWYQSPESEEDASDTSEALPEKYAPTGPEPPADRIEAAARAITELIARSGKSHTDGGRMVTYYHAIVGILRETPAPPAHLCGNDFRWAARHLIEAGLASVVSASPGITLCLSALQRATRAGRPHKDANGNYHSEFVTHRAPVLHLNAGEELFRRWREKVPLLRRVVPVVSNGPQREQRRGQKAKRSTERGEGRTKLVAALSKHHRYSDGSCLNPEPIGNNKLAKAAGVSPSTASTFFNDKFQGHTKYKALCRDSGSLAAALKLLNGEYSPHDLYGRRSADEDGRGDEIE